MLRGVPSVSVVTSLRIFRDFVSSPETHHDDEASLRRALRIALSGIGTAQNINIFKYICVCIYIYSLFVCVCVCARVCTHTHTEFL